MDSRSDLIMDLITRAEQARIAEALHRQEELLIIHAATLSARRVRSLMVPASEVKVFAFQKSLLENIRDLGPRLYRSYPVSLDGTLAGVTGYVRVRDLLASDLLAHRGGEADWHPQIQPLLEVEGNSPVTPLLIDLLERRDIAALVKKDGANIGWITLDDVTETLMGVRG